MCAWTAAGLSHEKCNARSYGEASERAVEFTRRQIGILSSGGHFPEIDIATTGTWAADPARTTYLLDVRTPAVSSAIFPDPVAEPIPS